jgi:diguanylate cyclase (GGDEF)-like protein
MSFGSIASVPYLVAALLAATSLALALVVTHLLGRVRRQSRFLDAETDRRRQVEEEIERVRSDLEDRVRQRTQTLEHRNEELMGLRLALETANQRLRRLVAVDALTGIANRRHFDRALARELRRTRRERQPLSLVFLDLDEFKRFNDTYGHARGDEVLRKVAQTLDESFRRGGDLVARYGGEEFAVVLPGVDGRRASLYAERLRRRIWQLSIPYAASQTTDRVTISGGVATIAAGRSASAEQVLLVADRALYRAKCLGKNRIVAATVETESLDDSSAIGLAS